jgi:hypothetical protein
MTLAVARASLRSRTFFATTGIVVSYAPPSAVVANAGDALVQEAVRDLLNPVELVRYGPSRARAPALAGDLHQP